MNGLTDADLATIRKVVAHFLFCPEVKAKYAAAFVAEARTLQQKLDAEQERREHMARKGRPGASPA